MKNIVYALFFVSAFASAQKRKETISGTVTAAGKPVPFANILILNAQNGTSAGEDGSYTLTLPAGTVKLQVEAIGFKTISKTINTEDYRNAPLNFELGQDQMDLKEVVITTGVSKATQL